MLRRGLRSVESSVGIEVAPHLLFFGKRCNVFAPKRLRYVALLSHDHYSLVALNVKHLVDVIKEKYLQEKSVKNIYKEGI